MTEFLSSPGGRFAHYRPQHGTAIMAGDHAEIVRHTRRLSASDAEDFDMFEFADYGGWEVITTPPQNEAERALCRAEEIRVAEEKRQEREEVERQARLEAEQAARDEAEWAAYAAWKKENLSGLHKTTVYPAQWHPDATERTIWDYVSGEMIHWSSRVGWYTTGDTYYPLNIDGMRGWFCEYGNAALAYVPRAVAERWYQEKWDRLKGDPREARYQWRSWKKYGEGVYGGDFTAWIVSTIGLDRIRELAGAVPVIVEGLKTEDMNREDLLFDSYRGSVRQTALWATPETITKLREKGYNPRIATSFENM